VADLDAASLQISAMPSFASKWLAPRLARFTAAHPGLQVRVSGADRRADFQRDGVDIGLRYGDGGADDGVSSELIARAVAFPVCSPALAEACRGDPASLTAAQLLHDESSLVAPGLPTWSAWFAEAGLAEPAGDGALVFSNSHMALSAAIAGQGFALGLSPLVDDDLAAGRLVRPFAGELESAFGFWFVCREERLAEPKIAAFRDWLFAETRRPA
jgi:LysR family glycine cleavage system transcriptional activator